LFKNRRSDIDIICGILKLSSNGARKTEILYQGNFSYTQLQSYLPYLIKRDVLEENIISENGMRYKLYKTTNKGLELIEDIENIMNKLK